jgi:hypothetical protein
MLYIYSEFISAAFGYCNPWMQIVCLKLGFCF